MDLRGKYFDEILFKIEFEHHISLPVARADQKSRQLISPKRKIVYQIKATFLASDLVIDLIRKILAREGATSHLP